MVTQMCCCISEEANQVNFVGIVIPSASVDLKQRALQMNVVRPTSLANIQVLYGILPSPVDRGVHCLLLVPERHNEISAIARAHQGHMVADQVYVGPVEEKIKGETRMDSAYLSTKCSCIKMPSTSMD